MSRRRQVATVFTVKQAALLLSIRAATLERLIAAGLVLTVTLRGRPMVPRSEIHHLAAILRDL